MGNNNKEIIIQRGLDGNEIEVNTGEQPYDGPNLSATMKSLVKEFLEETERDPLKTWAVSPDFDLAHAEAIIEEIKILGVCLPKEAERFLNKPIDSESGREYQIKLKAAFFLWLIGLRIDKVRERDLEQRSRMGIKPTRLCERANKLELGRLDPNSLLNE